MEKLMNILKDLRPDVDFENEKKLIDGSVLDSFDIVSLIGEISEAFGVEIGIDDIKSENFNSAGEIQAMICRIKQVK